MRHRFGRALRGWAQLLDPAPPAEIAADAPPDASGISRDVGLRDAVMHGWFDGTRGLLYPGVSIDAADVVADIGCGDGGAAAFCAKQGARVLLADVDEPRLQGARARLEAIAPGRIEVAVSDAAPLPFATAVATRVVCTEVIEHVANPAILLAELARIAAPGALLVLSCPDPRSEAVQKLLAPDMLFQHPNHIRVLDRATLCSLIASAGFAVERYDCYGFYWALWWSLFWETKTDFMSWQSHPVLEGWARVWDSVLDWPEGSRIQRALDAALPKSQVVVARRTPFGTAAAG